MSNARATRRRNWIWYQLGKFQQTPGLEPDAPTDLTAEYVQMPKVRLSAGIEPTSIEWPNLGYAEVYQDSFAIFDKLHEEGTILAGVRFQVEYPTPLASINGWLVPEDQDKVEPSYERALLDDLDRLLAPCRTTASPSSGTSPSSSAFSRWRSPVASGWTTSSSGWPATSTTCPPTFRLVSTSATATTSTST